MDGGSRRLAALLFGPLLMTLGAAPAVAAPRTVRLEYVRAAGAERCPDERWIRQAVMARLGFDPFSEQASVHVQATIRPAHKGLVGTLAMRDDAGKGLGRRELVSEAGDCLELASAMELAIAIAVDPHYLAREPAAPPPPPPQSPSPPAQPGPPVPPAPPAPPQAPAAGPDVELGGGLFGTAGLSPSVVPGATLGVRLRWPSFSLGVFGRGDLAATSALAGGSVTSWVLLGSVAPCAHLGRFLACGLFSAGALQVTGEIAATARRESSPLLLAGARAEADLPLTAGLLLRPFAELQAVLTRTTVLSGAQPVWVTAPVAGAVGAALWYDFP